MLKDFSLLATTSRGNERDACSELAYLLGEIGDSSPNVNRTGVSGVITAKTTMVPSDVVDGLRRILSERPYEFRFLLRVIPIEKVVRTDLASIQQVSAELGSRIKENETFRITVEKRFTALSTQQIIETAAAQIKREVNLEKPNKILMIEVVGGSTGISLVKPDGILSVLKEKLL
jgi:tRNA acetyltransferase TAN1